MDVRDLGLHGPQTIANYRWPVMFGRTRGPREADLKLADPNGRLVLKVACLQQPDQPGCVVAGEPVKAQVRLTRRLACPHFENKANLLTGNRSNFDNFSE